MPVINSVIVQGNNSQDILNSYNIYKVESPLVTTISTELYSEFPTLDHVDIQYTYSTLMSDAASQMLMIIGPVKFYDNANNLLSAILPDWVEEINSVVTISLATGSIAISNFSRVLPNYFNIDFCAWYSFSE